MLLISKITDIIRPVRRYNAQGSHQSFEAISLSFFFFNFRVKLLSPESHNNLTRTIIKTALKFRPKEIP